LCRLSIWDGSLCWFSVLGRVGRLAEKRFCFLWVCHKVVVTVFDAGSLCFSSVSRGYLRYDPCGIRGGARRSLLPFSGSLVYPPSPYYSLLGGAFTAGDCGPGAVIVVVRLMCQLFPSHFDVTKAPIFVVEVRCLLAVLLVTSTLFDSHFLSVDDFMSTPRDGTLFSGFFQRSLFHRDSGDNLAWRKRLALSVCPGEGTLAREGRRCVDVRHIVWFTMDVVCILVEYLLRLVFTGEPSGFEVWRTKHGPARYSHGPICFVPGIAPWCVSQG